MNPRIKYSLKFELRFFLKKIESCNLLQVDLNKVEKENQRQQQLQEEAK